MKDEPQKDNQIPSLELGVYEHYKGNKYEVIGVGLDTETLQSMVIYKPLYEAKVPLWVRPYSMFVSTVKIDEKEVPRFKKIG